MVNHRSTTPSTSQQRRHLTPSPHGNNASIILHAFHLTPSHLHHLPRSLHTTSSSSLQRHLPHHHPQPTAPCGHDLLKDGWRRGVAAAGFSRQNARADRCCDVYGVVERWLTKITKVKEKRLSKDHSPFESHEFPLDKRSGLTTTSTYRNI